MIRISLLLLVVVLFVAVGPAWAGPCADQTGFPEVNCAELDVYTIGTVIFPLTVLIWVVFIAYQVWRIILGLLS